MESESVAPDRERRLSGRVAWITGAGRGIGEAIAHRFAADGAQVAILARTRVDVDRVALACRKLGAVALGVDGDAAKPDVLRDMHEIIEQDLGPVDVMVNNVAMMEQRDLLDSDDEHWARVLSVNLLSAVRCARLVVPGMRERERGTIINVSSLHGTFGKPGWSAYAAAKGALNAFTRQQAIEQAPWGIRVNTLTPGTIHTHANEERLARADDPQSLMNMWEDAVPLRRLGQADEVAAVAAFLASDEAAFVTGAEYRVDGGQASSL
jgi:2-hydroxycyclohexanecarboxyl-CoA dehydrogenase